MGKDRLREKETESDRDRGRQRQKDTERKRGWEKGEIGFEDFRSWPGLRIRPW